jgi:hypothetical protein
LARAAAAVAAWVWVAETMAAAVPAVAVVLGVPATRWGAAEGMGMRVVVAEVERAVELGRLAELLGAAPEAVAAKVEEVVLL